MLIALAVSDFKRILGELIYKELDKKLKFLEYHIPFVNNYTMAYKERMAYSFNLDEYKRGDVIINKG